MSDLDPRLEPWLSALRDEPTPRREALARLKAALREEDVRAARRTLSSPAALAAAVVLAVLTSALWLALDPWHAPRHAVEPEVLAPAHFVLHAGGARSVSVVGDFNDWDPNATPLVETSEGVWSVVVRLKPGTVRYSFLVDGTEWRSDPRGVASQSDFGRPTSIAFIGRPEAS